MAGMRIRSIQAKSILTPQTRGFLKAGARPFTHSLSWAIGCGFGALYCGKYCYAPRLPNWQISRRPGEAWGRALIIKQNAPELLARQLRSARRRASMRIFMSPVTDPYQPIERNLRLTRRCLRIFAQHEDLDLLLIQTRGAAVIDDFDLIASIPYAWLSVSLETDRPDLPYGPTRAQIERRFKILRLAAERGIKAQIAVAPILPYSDAFAERLLAIGADRIVIDSFARGDGSQGSRTSSSPFAALADYDWRADDLADGLFQQLSAHHDRVSLGAEGFAGIPPRRGRE